ncbi:MAG: Lrp/AsnC ligand binding domain-containing protein [Nitrososphaeria archaeon]
MVKACILIKAVPVKGKRIVDELNKIEGIAKAFMVYGRADIVVFTEAKVYEDVLRIVDKIHTIDGVRSTETLVEAW